ncbi:MAG: VWA domain-containing protein, partial [Pyrinomonadaceae bacterium]|nr:VWA domain-containing protein [Pyrinomonadaceae bacterium]
MSHRKQVISGGLAVMLLGMLVFSEWLPTGAHGQNTTTSSAPQDASRPRRAANESMPQPTPARQQPSPGQQDDAALQDDEVVRVDTDLTNILFTATDKNRRFITTLRKEDIRILEDGQPQDIFTFTTQIDLPLTIAILIDTSRSQERTLPDEKAAARAFVDAIMRQGKDEAAVISFTGEVTLEQGLTGNVTRLRQAIEQVEFTPPSGYIGDGRVVGTPPISGTNQNLAFSTALWDAVWVTSEEVMSEAAEKTRRAIILVTDGDDTSSRKKMDEAIDRAIKADSLVFAIGIGDSYRFRGVDESALRKIAERTGGRAYFPRDEADLRAAFTQIQKELREQYLVAYAPTNTARDGSYRRIQIEIVNPELRGQNIRLNYRQGYFARSEA